MTPTTPDTRKFMQVLDDKTFKTLQRQARQRGTTVQQYIRIIVIPEWLKTQHDH